MGGGGGGPVPPPPPRYTRLWLVAIEIELSLTWSKILTFSNNDFDEFCLDYNIKVASETAAPKYE